MQHCALRLTQIVPKPKATKQWKKSIKKKYQYKTHFNCKKLFYLETCVSRAETISRYTTRVNDSSKGTKQSLLTVTFSW